MPPSHIDLREGDCIEVMKGLADNSIDAVVTDPPYHLTALTPGTFGHKKNGDGTDRTQQPNYARRGFMNQAWDGGDIAFRVELWSEVLRVLKPGGHVAAFAATRNGHRMAVAMEDAGFEVRDTVAWTFGAGLPKSLNVSRKLASLLPAGAQCVCDPDCPQIVPDCRDDYSSCSDLDDERPLSDQDSGPASLPSLSGAQRHIPGDRREDGLAEEAQYIRSASSDRHSIGDSSLVASRQIEHCLSSDSASLDISSNMLSAESTAGHKSQSHISDKQHSDDVSAVSSLSLSCVEYPHIPRCGACGKLKIVNGLGSALKPAWEMIYLCRKPLSEPTIAANVLRWGCEAINVDACRVGFGNETDSRIGTDFVSRGGDASRNENDNQVPNSHYVQMYKPSGRWPANLCLSYPVDEYELREDITTQQREELVNWMHANA